MLAEKELGEELKMMELRHAAPLVLAATLMCAGCTSSSNASAPANAPSAVASESKPESSPPAAKLPTGADPVNLDPANFSANITNPYWPMKPGTRWTYREVDEKGRTQEVVVVATTATKKLANGITARVVRDTAQKGGQIVEDTVDWYAQDSTGNVWYMGEDTAEFEKGKVVSRAGSFEAGKNGALPGIIMPAEPQVGQHYRQEYLKGEAEDNGDVLALQQMVEVPTDRYERAVLTRDTSPLEPTVAEYKLYAPGAGLVLTMDVSGGSGRETLVKIDKAGPKDGTGPIGKPNP
jgi:hypothetical protein